MKNLAELYNSLHNKVTHKADLLDVLSQLFFGAQENNYFVYFYHKLNKLLDKYPNKETFELTISEKIVIPNGLNGSQHSGVEKKALNECGRLKPGYRYKKGGDIVKIKKKKNSKSLKKKASKKAKEEKHQLALFVPKQKKNDGLKLSIQPINNSIYIGSKPKELVHDFEKGFSNVPTPKVIEIKKTPVAEKLAQPLSKQQQQQPTAKQLPDIAEYVKPKPTSKNNKLSSKLNRNKQRRFFNLKPQFHEINRFLGKIEVLEKESAVMTLSAPQGAGKSTVLFQFMNAFATSGYECLHASLEEHPDSSLYEEKAFKYLTPEAFDKIETPNYSRNNIDQFLKDIETADVVFIDSMKKLWQYIKGFDLDNNLRKKYNGKLFIIIFQLTTDGKMKGGTDAQYDGDIITFIDKGKRFSENYVYHDKNRYAVEPIHNLKYNIVNQAIIKEPDEATEKQRLPLKQIGKLVINSI